MNAILVRIADAFGREPLVITKAVVYLVTAILDAGIAFGLSLTPEQKGTLIVVVTAALQLAGDLFARSQVTPVADPRLPAEAFGDALAPFVRVTSTLPDFPVNTGTTK